MTRRALPWAVSAPAVGLLVAGALMLALAGPAGPPAATWFAYAPLAPETEVAYGSSLELSFDDDDGTVLWSAGQLVGAGLCVGGLLLLAGLVGWWVGRRGRRSTAQLS